MVTLEFGCVQTLSLESDRAYQPFVNMTSVTETGLIVCQYILYVRPTQYDRLSQQQLTFLLL